MAGSMKAGLAAAFLCSLAVAAPARAQLASHPSGEDSPGGPRRDRSGFYASLAGGGGLQFASTLDAKFGYGGQAKLGYSFNRNLQLLLAGSVHNASYTNSSGQIISKISQQLILIEGIAQHALFISRGGVRVYGSGGIGVGLASPGFGPTQATGIGLGFSAGIGVEIPLTPYFSLAPEFYYRAVNSANSDNGFSGSINVIGIQLGIVYY